MEVDRRHGAPAREDPLPLQAVGVDEVDAVGGVVCSTRVVLPIAADPTPTRGTASNLAPSDLGILEDCNGGGSGVIRFQNNGSQAGTLNWMFSEGGTASTVNATGNVLNPFPPRMDSSRRPDSNRGPLHYE
jgi:hypothetical protein